MDDQLRLVGSLKGHSDWVTQIATTPQVPNMSHATSRSSSGISNEKGATRPQSPRLRPRHLVGRPIRSLEFVGLDASPLGRPRGRHNATLRRTHERRPQRRLLGRQFPNRLGIARPNDQTLEYTYLVFMGAECLLLGLRALHAIAKHCIHVYDEARPGTWENQAVVSYYIDLVGEMAILGVDFVHRLHMMIWANVFLSMASLVIFMQLRTLYAEMRKRIDKHRNFVRVSQSLDTRFPLATKEQLEGNDDNCAICWDKMENARLLPCNHLFHLSCLRSWLEQDRSCPTCRVNLGETQETPSNEANWQPAVKTPRNMDLSPFVRNRGERRQNNWFRFDGRQLASWLPIFSVQVVQEGRQRPVTQMERMARAVQDVLPDYPMDLIMSDLAQTRSADQTVQNLTCTVI
ncbi:E3 ubiquitin-protein ligase AMFR-like [Oscarella lobularis]|uniref:E3 ubiquitin-protein ligase AMFR-like n=1 Tax=Oscarella lobularis TaxID=121494 RepID=UPI003313AAEB